MSLREHQCPHCQQMVALPSEQGQSEMRCPFCYQFSVAGEGSNRERPRVKKSPYYWAVGCPIVAIWLLIFVERTFGITVRRMLHLNFVPAKADAGDMLPIWVGIALSVLTPVVAYFFYRRAVRVAMDGLFVIGTVEKIGFKFQGMVEVTLSYTVGGKPVERLKSFDSADVEELVEGQRVELIVDRRKPKRCYLKSVMFGGGNA